LWGAILSNSLVESEPAGTGWTLSARAATHPALQTFAATPTSMSARLRAERALHAQPRLLNGRERTSLPECHAWAPAPAAAGPLCSALAPAGDKWKPFVVGRLLPNHVVKAGRVYYQPVADQVVQPLQREELDGAKRPTGAWVEKQVARKATLGVTAQLMEKSVVSEAVREKLPAKVAKRKRTLGSGSSSAQTKQVKSERTVERTEATKSKMRAWEKASAGHR